MPLLYAIAYGIPFLLVLINISVTVGYLDKFNDPDGECFIKYQFDVHHNSAEVIVSTLRKENEMTVTTQYMAKAFGRVSLQIASKPISGRVDKAIETQWRMQGVRTRDGNRSGRPAGRVAGRIEILRQAGQAG